MIFVDEGNPTMTNIALIVLDTLRKDAFDRYFNWLPGTRYETAFSTSHCTIPAHGSLFTGRYASEVGIHVGSPTFDCKTPLLAESLEAAGYTTRAFSANPFISPMFAADRGVQHFKGSWRLDGLDQDMFDWETFVVEQRESGPMRYVRALREVILGDYDTRASLAEGLRRKLRGWGVINDETPSDDGAMSMLNFVRDTEFSEKEFLFANLMEAHSPYSPPEEYRTGPAVDINELDETFGETSTPPDHIERAYEDSVRYLSTMYEQIFAELRDSFDIILTLADHGELLGEHGAWGHFYGLYPELTHVPLVVWQGERKPSTETASVSLLDAYATVMDAAGVERAGRGRPLISPVDDGEHLVEYHGIDDRQRAAIHNRSHKDAGFLETTLAGVSYGDYYGYETFFDGITEFGDCPYDNVAEQLRQLQDDLDISGDANLSADLSEATLQQLRDLGYA